MDAAPEPSGSHVLDLAAVMDRLRSPGGCPWDAQQTHASLAPYALEEAFEVVDAIEEGSPADLREELGDLLLQVVFHARVAQEGAPGTRFALDDVADGIVAKLVRRHPHVFATPGSAASAADVEAGWEALKKVEKGRASVLDGIPAALPALARAAKVLRRARREGLLPPLPHGAGEDRGRPPTDPPAAGDRLLGLVQELTTADPDLDVEGALRCSVRALEVQVRGVESGRNG